ncbi:hypothetical protein, partial [Paraburkholderia phenoliruptrix]
VPRLASSCALLSQRETTRFVSSRIARDADPQIDRDVTAWRVANMPPTRREQRVASRRANAIARAASLDPAVVIFKVDYRASETDVILREEFNAVREYPRAAESEDLTACLDDPAFWQWLGARLAAASIPVERIVALKAARATGPVVTLLSDDALPREHQAIAARGSCEHA